MNSCKAFSLIEMVITLALIAIVAAFTLPAWRDFFTRAQDKIMQDKLLHAIQLAQREAEIRHVPIAMCKSNNQNTCSGNWAEGQLIFIDVNADGVIHTKEQILAAIKSNAKHGIIYWRSFPYYRDYLQFSPSGFMHNDNGTFWYCHDENSAPVWAITLNPVGQIRSHYPNADGVLKDSKGKLLGCKSKI